jgi:hypothetical protein
METPQSNKNEAPKQRIEYIEEGKGYFISIDNKRFTPHDLDFKTAGDAQKFIDGQRKIAETLNRPDLDIEKFMSRYKIIKSPEKQG